MTNRVTITLHIDLPDGVVPDVEYGEAPRDRTVTVSDNMDRFGPFPPEEPPNLMDEAKRIFDQPPAAPVCPQGHGPMKFVPAGVSKRNGKAYDAFWGCQNRDCKQTAKAA